MFEKVPTRILMTADTVGGVWTYAMELTRGLGAYGIEVALATMGEAMSQGQRREAEALRNVEVFESRYKLEWMRDPWNEVREAGEWLLKLEAEIGAELVHLNGYAHGDLPWKSPVLMVGHSCVVSWWEAVRGGRAPEEWDRYREAVKKGLAGAGMVIAPTRAMLDKLQEHYGPLRSKRVIPNGRSAEYFCAGAKERIVFTAGRIWDEAKNVATLAEIAARLPWPVYVAGGASSPDGGAAEFGNVNLLGELGPEEMRSCYSRAAIYAMPARYEPFGLSILEAGLSGCALVLGDVPSLRENWEGAALFVPPENGAALRRHLAWLMEGERQMEVLGSAARRRALKYTTQTMAEGYARAYEDLHVRAGAMGRKKRDS
jgi:glycogen synthase